MCQILKIRCLAMFALALILIASAPVLAEERSGTIAWIEADDHTFTLVSDENEILEMRFLIGGEVRVDGQDSTFWDVFPGDRVSVTFDRASEGLEATALECRRTN